MGYKGIKDLFIRDGKIIFRKHIRINKKDFNIWKTIGREEDFSEEQLKEIVKELNQKIYEEIKKKNLSPDSLIINNKKDYTFLNQYRETQGPALKEVINRFLLWYKMNKRPESYRRYVICSKFVLKFFGEKISISHINMGMIEEYKIWRKKQGVTDNTINKELRFLSTLINKAVEFEWIKEHKLFRKAILIKGVKSERIRYLTTEEEERLISAIKSLKNYLLLDIVLFALNTGMRLNEILGLKWENVKYKEKLIVLFPEQTKNKKIHIIPINQKAFEIIEKRFETKDRRCPYVFHRNGEKVKSIKEGFTNALKKANIKNFTFHDLRHTFASRLVQKGIDLYVVKELLNHSSITVTQRYAHLKLENMKKAVEILEK